MVHGIELRTIRFDKTAPEPRAGLPSGHMPGAISLPFIELMDPSKNRKVFLGKDQLKEQFTKRGIDLTQPIVCSCGIYILRPCLTCLIMW